MTWAPSEPTRIAVKFWLDCLQIVTIVVGVSAVGLTAIKYREEQRQAARQQNERAKEQAERSREQIASIRRELRRPYEERKLALYLEASRVLAHLAASPDVESEKYEARFWELYWGELAFVESTTADEAKGGPQPSVEKLMVEFCHQRFQGRCSKGDLASRGDTKQPVAIAAAAIDLARQASLEIRADWDEPQR
jgi:hypothetical protein